MEEERARFMGQVIGKILCLHHEGTLVVDRLMDEILEVQGTSKQDLLTMPEREA